MDVLISNIKPLNVYFDKKKTQGTLKASLLLVNGTHYKFGNIVHVVFDVKVTQTQSRCRDSLWSTQLILFI